MPAPKPKRTGLIIALVIGGIALCCVAPIALLGGGGLFAFNKMKGTFDCAIGVMDARASLLEYAKSNGGKLPSADTWQDDIAPFFTKITDARGQTGPFKSFDPNGEWGCKAEDGSMTGIAYNQDLSGKAVNDIKDQMKTIALFEIDKPVRNAAQVYKARDDKSGPPMLMGQKRGWIRIPLAGGLELPGPDGKLMEQSTFEQLQKGQAK